MAAATTLVVVIFADGSRSSPFQVPASGHADGWFQAAMRYAAGAVLPAQPEIRKTIAAELAQMIVAGPDGSVEVYGAAETRQLLGGAL